MSETLKNHEVALKALRWNCDPDSMGVESTQDVDKLQEKVIAQERAVSALKFGMGVPGNDYKYICGR